MDLDLFSSALFVKPCEASAIHDRPQRIMHVAQAPYRKLLDQLDRSNTGAVESIIKQWLTTNTSEIAWIEALGRVRASGVPPMTLEDLWRLYALSRVSDALIRLLEKDRAHTPCYSAFMNGLGLRQIAANTFHPFYHEVVTVIPSPASADPIAIASVTWPGFMCGPLMIARAGVAVTGGAQHIRKDIAETSTLYWCYRRATRPTQDLSKGWGSNSQWRTAFRRDYCLENQHYYNVDGDNDPGDPILNEREKLELLRHRCFLVSDRSHSDLFPYGLRHNEPMT